MAQSVCLNSAVLTSAAAATRQARPAAMGFGPALTGLVLQMLEWQRRARERDSLASLSDAALRDVGLSRVDIYPEIAKPFWRV